MNEKKLKVKPFFQNYRLQRKPVVQPWLLLLVKFLAVAVAFLCIGLL
jgi:hypothetical protein